MTDQTPIQTDCPVEQSFIKAVSGGLAAQAIEAVRSAFPAVVSLTDYDTADAKKSALNKAVRDIARQREVEKQMSAGIA